MFRPGFCERSLRGNSRQEVSAHGYVGRAARREGRGADSFSQIGAEHMGGRLPLQMATLAVAREGTDAVGSTAAR